MSQRLSGCTHLKWWAEGYPKYAPRLLDNARLEADELIFDVETWGEANAILYAVTPRSPGDPGPPHGE